MTKFEFCIPTVGKVVPGGAELVHEIKYDGYRLRAEREGLAVRLITPKGTAMNKPVVSPLEHKCPECMGTGYVVTEHPIRPRVRIYTECKECKGKGHVAAD